MVIVNESFRVTDLTVSLLPRIGRASDERKDKFLRFLRNFAGRLVIVHIYLSIITPFLAQFLLAEKWS